ncbi:MAG: TonB-dependent receptor [Aureispira sp.]
MKTCVLGLLFTALFLFSQHAQAQKTGGVRGTVYDKATGEPMIGALAYLTTDYGAATDINGDYSINGVPPGDYVLVIKYLGYDSVAISLTIGSKMLNETVLMEETTVGGPIVEVDAARTAAQNDVQVSVVRITPKDIKRIPAAGGEADFAQYLQVIPGIVSTGDQGGQLYIRGGAPVQNRILLDGMTLFNAFHSIGFFSVFETETIRSADVYTGGFSAKYGGRSSAVVDIKTREGNKTRFAGMVNINPFVVKGLFEGPLVRLDDNGSSLSFLMTVKHSYLREVSPLLYSYANDAGVLPYNFTDGHAKLSFNAANGSRINLFGFYHYDDVDFVDLAAYNWNAGGGGIDFRIVPNGAQLALSGVLAYSVYGSDFNEQGNSSKIRRSDVGNFNGSLNVNYYLPKSRVASFGVEINSITTAFEYSTDNNSITQGSGNGPQTNFEAAMFAHFSGRFGTVVIEPSVRLQAYASLGEVAIEPRLGFKWNITSFLRFKAAGGMYSQNLISSVDERDIVNLFVGFLGGPDDNVYRLRETNDGTRFYEKTRSSLQTSIHAIGGFEVDVVRNLTINVEPYYKYFPQIISLNRNRTADDGQRRNFVAETGDAYGLDFSATYDNKQLYLYASYALGYVTRNDGINQFFAHFDRRHNINFVGSYQFRIGKLKETPRENVKNRTMYPFEVGVRWNMGSGFPFTRTQGFYANQTFLDGIGTNYLTDNTAPNTDLGVIYEEEINLGRLPFYHRLDVSLKYTLDLIGHSKLTISASVTNAYDRANIFYFDRIEYKRINQLPIMPALNLNLKF